MFLKNLLKMNEKNATLKTHFINCCFLYFFGVFCFWTPNLSNWQCPHCATIASKLRLKTKTNWQREKKYILFVDEIFTAHWQIHGDTDDTIHTYTLDTWTTTHTDVNRVRLNSSSEKKFAQSKWYVHFAYKQFYQFHCNNYFVWKKEKWFTHN